MQWLTIAAVQQAIPSCRFPQYLHVPFPNTFNQSTNLSNCRADLTAKNGRLADLRKELVQATFRGSLPSDKARHDLEQARRHCTLLGWVTSADDEDWAPQDRLTALVRRAVYLHEVLKVEHETQRKLDLDWSKFR